MPFVMYFFVVLGIKVNIIVTTDEAVKDFRLFEILLFKWIS